MLSNQLQTLTALAVLLLVSVKAFVLSQTHQQHQNSRDSKTCCDAGRAAVAEEQAASTLTKDATDSHREVSVRWLEGNSWHWTVGGVRVLVDPVYSTLDFGIPAVYKADKKVFSDYDKLINEMSQQVDYITITQSLDDHCDSETLEKLAALAPKSVKVVVPRSAEKKVGKHFPQSRMIVMEPGDTIKLTTESGGAAQLKAVAGSVVGPPWQAPENGYYIKPLGSEASNGIFYEPHCMWKENDIQGLKADMVITPTYGQRLSFYRILNSGSRAVELAKLLQARSIVTYNNVEMESEGFLTKIVTQTGDLQEFEREAKAAKFDFVQAEPGVTVTR